MFTELEAWTPYLLPFLLAWTLDDSHPVTGVVGSHAHSGCTDIFIGRRSEALGHSYVRTALGYHFKFILTLIRSTALLLFWSQGSSVSRQNASTIHHTILAPYADFDQLWTTMHFNVILFHLSIQGSFSGEIMFPYALTMHMMTFLYLN